MKSMGLQKSQFLNSLVNWGKLEIPARATFKNPKLSLSNGKIFEILPNFCPNLRFTVENEISNLHKIRLLTFET